MDHKTDYTAVEVEAKTKEMDLMDQEHLDQEVEVREDLDRQDHLDHQEKLELEEVEEEEIILEDQVEL
jgi:hypothetical protein